MQNAPRGRWYFTLRESSSCPASTRDTARGSPSRASMVRPSRSTETRRPEAEEDRRAMGRRLFGKSSTREGPPGGPGPGRGRASEGDARWFYRSEEHTSELQSRENLVCRLLLEKKKTKISEEE